MKVITLQLKEDQVREMDALHYEVQARKQLLAFYLSQDLDTDNEEFIKCKREYVELFTKLERTKLEFEANFLSEHPNRHRWWLTSNPGEVKLELRDEA